MNTSLSGNTLHPVKSSEQVAFPFLQERVSTSAALIGVNQLNPLMTLCCSLHSSVGRSVCPVLISSLFICDRARGGGGDFQKKLRAITAIFTKPVSWREGSLAGIMCIISWQGCQRCQGCQSFGNLFTFNYVHHFMASLSELPKLPEVWQPLHFLLCASEISEIFVRYGMEGQEIRGGYEWPWVQDA